MNIVKEQAKDFIESTEVPYSNYRLYMSRVKEWLFEYNKSSSQAEFLSSLISHFKKEMDEVASNYKNPDERIDIQQYQHLIFRLNDELEEVKENVPQGTFFEEDKQLVNEKIEEILREMQTLKNGQEIIYEDLSKELNEMKEYFFLNKKTWSQLFIGKLSTMISSGVISQTASTKIVELIQEDYSNLIESL
ncbi:MAG: hypothetical protein WED10_06360 [Brumimicrobium sp.]